MKGVLTTAACALPALALAAAGCYCIYISFGWVHILIYLLACLLFFPVAALLHEAGHLVFGGISGMRVKLGRPRVFAPSSCTVMPRRSGKMRRRFIVTALGGLAVNLLTAAVGMGLLFAGGAALYFSFLAPASFYLFMINVLPAEYAGGGTDMLLAMRAAKNTAEWQVLARVLDIQGMVAEGRALADIDEDYFFSVPQIAEDESAFIMLVSLRADYYNAKGDGANAAKWEERREELRAYIPQ